MKTWTPYGKGMTGGGSDFRIDDIDVPPISDEEAAAARLTVCDIVAREDNPYDAHDAHEFLDMLGLLP